MMNAAKREAASLEEGRGGASSSKKAKFMFPGRHSNSAAAVFRGDVCFRDNSLYVKKLFEFEASNAISFTRPMQLGKTTLLSLADELFSVNKESKVYEGLRYKPDDEDRNQWFVLHLNFGNAFYSPSRNDDPNDPEWIQRGKCLDNETKSILLSKIRTLVQKNPNLEAEFRKGATDDVRNLSVMAAMNSLMTAVAALDASLLILVDEYDQPVRETLLQFLPEHGHGMYRNIKKQLKSTFPHYFGFFRAAKTALETLSKAKVWMMGVTPVAIKEFTGLIVSPLAFDEDLADAVGLTEDDVRNMLVEVDKRAPFEIGERERAEELLKVAFNRLRFPDGSPLYHTALVNGAMNLLLSKPAARKRWLDTGKTPSSLGREPTPASVYDVLTNAPNLRHVVNALIEGRAISGALNESLSLEDLLCKDIAVGDYLTLLVHIGVVSVQHEGHSQCFKLAGRAYCDELLRPLLNVLKSSLVTLVSLNNVQDLYAEGEAILTDFVTSISQRSMTKLMVWASSDPGNHILELQFQSHVVTDAHNILDGSALTTQEDTQPATGKRTDVTFSSDTAVVILELKQLPTATRPPQAFLDRAHRQLTGYVQTRRAMEAAASHADRPVAGFVVVMYDDGAKYVVEKLRSDN